MRHSGNCHFLARFQSGPVKDCLFSRRRLQGSRTHRNTSVSLNLAAGQLALPRNTESGQQSLDRVSLCQKEDEIAEEARQLLLGAPTKEMPENTRKWISWALHPKDSHPSMAHGAS